MEREKKILIGVLVFIVVTILVIGLRGTNKKVERIVEVEKQVQQEASKKVEEKKIVEEEEQPLKEEKTKEVVNDYSESNDTFMKDAYMDGCYNGSNFAYCECTFDKLVSKYGIDFVINIGREYETTGVTPLTEDIMTEIAMECLVETN